MNSRFWTMNSFSLVQENIHPCDDGGQYSNDTCDTKEIQEEDIQEEDIKEWISEATLNTEQYVVVAGAQWAKWVLHDFAVAYQLDQVSRHFPPLITLASQFGIVVN